VVDDATAAHALLESGAVAVLGDAPVSVLIERVARSLPTSVTDAPL
jgi:hypothetical protein